MKQRSHAPLHKIRFSVPLFFFLPLFFLCMLFMSRSFAAPELSASLDVATEGYFVLAWESPVSGSALRLQQALTQDFDAEVEEWRVDGATQFTQSGLTDGRYYYRLVDSDGAGNTVGVEVRHHSLARAGLFFSLGAALFVILIAVLIYGRRQHQGA